ncbi:MAG: sugar phosphate isomerase/epimerase [Planctomycetota bacterium]
MPMPKLAVQLYTLRDYCKTEDDLASTAKRLAEQGWPAVQVSAVGVEDPATVRQILDEHGLVCVATHVRPPSSAWETPDQVASDHKTLGCDLTAVGGFFPSAEDATEATWLAWIEQFNDGVAKLKERGVRFGYHNHSHEWAKLGGKDAFEAKRPMDLLVEHVHPDAWFEIDTYWVAHAGGCPAAWLRKLKGRVPLIHVKDLAIDAGRTQYMAEIGVGNLDWNSVMAAADEAGVECYCVEQDTCYRDPFDSLETSLKNLKAMGLG